MSFFKSLSVSTAFLAFLLIAPSPAMGAEDWKGKPYDYRFTAGAVSGLSIVDGRAGFGLHGLAAYKIAHHGFLEDINNQLFLEAAAGPVFLSGGTGFQYSLHLRWDFHKDYQWSLFALGGLGGTFTGATLGDRREIHPRFGIGAFWHLFEHVSLRGELSHEFTGVGAVLEF